ncbi:uncharacterized protein [Ambystoma mexicanum]
MVNEKKAQKCAFQIFLARIECELILEMSNGGKTHDCLKLLKKRAAIPGNNDEEVEREEQPLVKEAHQRETSTCPNIIQSLPGREELTTASSDGKGRDHFSSDKGRMVRTTGMYEPHPPADTKLGRKGVRSVVLSADSCTRKGLLVSDLNESVRKCEAYCPESPDHKKAPKGLNLAYSTENSMMERRELNPSKLGENINLGIKGLGLPESPGSIAIEMKGLKPATSARNSKLHSNRLNPEFANNIKMDRKALNPSDSGENTNNGSKGLNPSESNGKPKEDTKRLIPSRLAENAQVDRTGLNPLKSPPYAKVDSTEFNGFNTNAERHVESMGKNPSESTEDRKVKNRAGLPAESAQDKKGSKGIARSESVSGVINCDVTNDSDLSSKIHVQSSGGDSTNKNLAPKGQAVENFQSARSESEEFLTQYSDINIAKKPLFPKKGSQRHKKPIEKKNGPGREATLLEESTFARASPLKFQESATLLEESTLAKTSSLTCQENAAMPEESNPATTIPLKSFVSCTEPNSGNGKPTNQSEAIPETFYFATHTTLTLAPSLSKPSTVKTHAVKSEIAPSPCNAPFAEGDIPTNDDSDLAKSFSKLNISDPVEEDFAYTIEETTNAESVTIRNSPPKNSNKTNHVQIDPSHRICNCTVYNSVAEVDSTLQKELLGFDESSEDVNVESFKRPCKDQAAAERPSQNIREVGEAPAPTDIPPESLKSLTLKDSCIDTHFNFTQHNEPKPSTNRVPVGDSVFQMKDDTKGDFVLVSRVAFPEN